MAETARAHVVVQLGRHSAGVTDGESGQKTGSRFRQTQRSFDESVFEGRRDAERAGSALDDLCVVCEDDQGGPLSPARRLHLPDDSNLGTEIEAITRFDTDAHRHRQRGWAIANADRRRLCVEPESPVLAD